MYTNVVESSSIFCNIFMLSLAIFATSRFFLRFLLPIIFITFIWLATLMLEVTNVLLELWRLMFWLLLLLLLLAKKRNRNKNRCSKLYIYQRYDNYTHYWLIKFYSNLLMLFTTVATASNIVNVIPANINGTYFNIQNYISLRFLMWMYLYGSSNPWKHIKRINLPNDSTWHLKQFLCIV